MLGLVAATVIATAGQQTLPEWRLYVLIAAAAAFFLLFIVALIIGIKWPNEFHYGAEQRLESERMDKLGDSLAGRVGSGSLTPSANTSPPEKNQ